MANDDDIDALLAKESSEHTRDTEIDRILNTFPLDAYSVLDLQPGVSPGDIKNTYRKKSLLIHPDKTKNARAPDAFDRLKKAERALADDAARAALDAAFTDARRILMRERRWTIHDERLKSAEFLADWRDKTREVLVQTELRKRRLQKAQMEEEGRRKQQQEQELEERRKRREQERAWEDSRDTRVRQWRDFRKKRDAASAAAAASDSKTSTSALNANAAATKIHTASSSGISKAPNKKKKKIKGALEVLG